jgi:hypothetical protein
MATARRGKNVPNTDKGPKPVANMSRPRRETAGANGIPAGYWKACDPAREGRYDEARLAYARLQRSAAKKNTRLSALIDNDLAVIAAMKGQLGEACDAWRTVLDRDPTCEPARRNLALIEADHPTAGAPDSKSETRAPVGNSSPTRHFEADRNTRSGPPPSVFRPPPCPRIGQSSGQSLPRR